MLDEVAPCIVLQIPGGPQNRTGDLHKKGSAFILSSDRWTEGCQVTAWL